MSDPAKRPYLSASQMGLYNKCAEAYRRRYIEREVIPPGAAMVRGTALHKGAEHNFRQKIQSRSDLPAGDIVEFAVETARTVMDKEGLWLTVEEESRGAVAIIGEVIDSAAKLAGALMSEVAPTIMPVAVEEEVVIAMPESTHDLKGIMDIRTAESVEDFKTGKKMKGHKHWVSDSQMALYSLMHRARAGFDPTIRVHELLDQKKARTETVELTYGEDDYKPLVRRINATLKGINAGFFPPTTPGAWWCSPDWCGYWQTCPYVNSERRDAAKKMKDEG